MIFLKKNPERKYILVLKICLRVNIIKTIGLRQTDRWNSLIF